MRRILTFLSLLAVCYLLPTPSVMSVAHAQQQLIYCQKGATDVACNSTTGPINTGNGDYPYQAFGKLNVMLAQIYEAYGKTSNFYTNGVLLATDIASLWTGCSGTTPVLSYTGACTAGGGGGSMTWPSGGAGIPNYSGSNSWGMTYNSSYAIPANFLPAALSSSSAINGVTIPGTGSTAVTAATTTTAGLCNESTTTAGFSTYTTCPAGGSGTVGSGTSGQVPIYASSGTAVQGATAQSCLSVNTSASTIGIAANINAQTGTTYTFASTDACKLVTFSNTSAVAVTLPQATTTGFGAGFSVDVENVNTGLVTITPTTSTINGAASLAVASNSGCSITSDGTNYQISACVALSAIRVASGTATLGTSAISSATCATTVTVTATGVLTTDTINASFNGSPIGVVGYEPSASGMLTIISWPTSGDVNFAVCNNTSSSITPGAITLNWHVLR